MLGRKKWIRNLIVAGGLATSALAPQAAHGLTYNGARALAASPAAVWNIQDEDTRTKAAEAMGGAFNVDPNSLLKMSPQDGHNFLQKVYQDDRANGVTDDHQIVDYTNNMKKMTRSGSGGGNTGLSQKDIRNMNQDYIQRQQALQGNNG